MTARIAALVLAAALAAPASAAARTETATAGTVTATLTWTEREDGPPYAEDQRITITDAGSPILDERVPDKRFLTPGGVLTNRKSIAALDFDGNGTVEVVVDEFTGGAHCCFDAWIYEGDVKHVQHFGDVGYRLKDVDGDGSPEFRSNDPAFSGAFTSFAASQFPLQVLDWRGDGLVDVTRSDAVRPRVAAQAKRFKARYDRARRRLARHPRDLGAQELIRSSLAAYAADACLLGTPRTGFRLLERAAARDEVRPGFPKQVRRFLARLGYTG